MQIKELERKSKENYWVPEPIWRRQTVFVIGGGPSLVHFNIKKLSAFNCIAVNNAYLIAPWAQFLFFHDRRWLEWHAEGVARFKGETVTTYTKSLKNAGHTVLRMRKARDIAINCTDRDCLGGIDSGTMALNLAFHLGAKTIALVGFDMGFMDADKSGLTEEKLVQLQTPLFHPDYQMPASRSVDTSVLKHWHQEHPIPPRASNYVNFLAQYDNIVRALKAQNVRLVSLTNTLIKIPKVRIGEI